MGDPAITAISLNVCNFLVTLFPCYFIDGIYYAFSSVFISFIKEPTKGFLSLSPQNSLPVVRGARVSIRRQLTLTLRYLSSLLHLFHTRYIYN